MENEPHTPDELAALRRHQKQRLKDQAEALLKAYEALEPPQTHAEVDRAAKALMSIDKALDQIHGPQPDAAQIEEAPVFPDTQEALRPVYAAMYRRLARIDERLGRTSVYTQLAASLDP